MDAIQQSFHQMMATFHKRLDSIEGQLPSTPPQTSEGLAAEFVAFKSFVLTTFRAVEKQISMLAQQIDHGEMRARRKILLLHGLPEEPSERTSELVAKVLSERLKLANLSCTDISRCHRMGQATPGKARPVLFKLADVALRDKIWSTKTSLKGTKLTLSEFLTRTRHEVFMAARKRFGITRCWTREGTIFIKGLNNVTQRVDSLEEVAAMPCDTVSVDADAKVHETRRAASASRDQKSVRPRKGKLLSK